MKWKKGDKFVSISNISKNTRLKGKIYEIVNVDFINNGISYIAESGKRTYTVQDKTMEILNVLDNPLNKKLYPKRVEWQGYLIAAEIRDKLNEDDK